MEDIVKRLTELLDNEVKCFEKIQNILLREQRCLVENDKEALEEILSEKEDVMSSLSCLEKSRHNLLEKLSVEFGEDVSELTVSRISERMGGEKGRRLRETGRSLKSHYDQIKRTEWSNSKLIQQSLEYNRKSLLFIHSLLGQPGTYDVDGGIDTREDMSLMINHCL